VFLIALLLTLALHLFMDHTRSGQAVRATAQNRHAAAMLGIDSNHINALAFGIGAALAGTRNRAEQTGHCVLTFCVADMIKLRAPLPPCRSLDPSAAHEMSDRRLERRSRVRHQCRLEDKNDRYEVLERLLDFEGALKIEEFDLKGIYLESVGRRVRPLGNVGQNVVGCFSEDCRPLGGVELVWDEVLKGTPGRRRFLRDALGNPRPCVGAVLEEPVSGRSVVLTIDSDLQGVAEAALEEAIEEHKAKGGCVVVADPWNGDILALASSPRGSNFPVRTVFEPGSAFKIVTFACALDLGKVDTTDIFDTNGGVLKVKGGLIRDDHPHDILNLIDAFAVSSNVAAAMIARRIGEWDFYRRVRAFGFGLHRRG